MDIELVIRRMGWERNKHTLAVPPRVDEASLEHARRLHAEGRYEASLEYLSGYKECVDDARCLRLAGLCHLGLGHCDEAIGLFTLSRETSMSELARDEINLCMALLTAARFSDAIAAARRAVQLAPAEPGPHINLVSALRRANDEIQLERHLAELTNNFPDILASDLFQDRLARDPDFIGVAERLEKVGRRTR